MWLKRWKHYKVSMVELHHETSKNNDNKYIYLNHKQKSYNFSWPENICGQPLPNLYVHKFPKPQKPLCNLPFSIIFNAALRIILLYVKIQQMDFQQTKMFLEKQNWGYLKSCTAG